MTIQAWEKRQFLHVCNSISVGEKKISEKHRSISELYISKNAKITKSSQLGHKLSSQFSALLQIVMKMYFWNQGKAIKIQEDFQYLYLINYSVQNIRTGSDKQNCHLKCLFRPRIRRAMPTNILQVLGGQKTTIKF